MRKLIAALVSLVALGGLAVPASASVRPADRDNCLPFSGPLFGPVTVSVGLRPTVAGFVVNSADVENCRWRLRIPDLGVDVDNADPLAAFDPGFLVNRDVAPASVDIRYTDYSGKPVSQVVVPGGFGLRRATTWASTATVSPTRISPGDTLRLTGQLARANWETGHYERCCAASTVYAQYSYNKLAWTTLARGTTDASGTAHVSVTPTGDYATTGYWRLLFPGNTVAGASPSRATHVVVG